MPVRNPWFTPYENAQNSKGFDQHSVPSEHDCTCRDSDEIAHVLALGKGIADACT